MTAITARQRWQRAYSDARYWPKGRPRDEVLRWGLWKFFGSAFPPPFPRTFAASPVSVAAADWWLAGGAPTPIAAYQPKGAASLAASYVNLVTPGTYDAAPGTAPTLDASGWVFNGTDQYLTTGVTLLRNPADICLFVRCTGATRATLIGNISTNLCRILPRWMPGTLFQYSDTNAFGTLGDSIDGVFALTFFGHYFNGVLDAAYSGTDAVDAGVCCIGGVPGNFNGATVQAAAIYFASTMTEAHVIAVSAAMALL